MSESLPIREISKLTGVNTVTLRAWERRYGLLKPLRTNKGHRLYRVEDVELVKTIQSWLSRGLSISKVSELIESGQHENTLDVENIWQTHFQSLVAIISSLNVGKLESFIGELFSVYPADIIADFLMSPLLDHLNKNTYGNNVKKALLINRVSEYLLMLVQRHRNQGNGPRIAIIQISSESNSLLNVLLHYGLTLNHYRCEYIGSVPVDEVVFLQENLSFDAFVVYSDSTNSLTEFQKALTQLTQKISAPVIVAGKLADALKLNIPENIFVAENGGQKAAIDKLN